MAKVKSPKTTTQPLKERAIRAALDLSAGQGWENTTLENVAAACKCTLSDLHRIFVDRTDILVAYGQHLDDRLKKDISVDMAGTERDRLFDVLMERFDILNEDRAGVVSILKSFCIDPKQGVVSIPHLGRSMIEMLDVAGVNTDGPRGAAVAFGLMCVYLFALKAWIDDESEDLSKTMAALDRALGHAENLAGVLFRFG